MKLAILGSGDSLTEAPFHNPEFEFWGQNNLFLDLPNDINITAWFQLHNISSAEEFQFLQSLKCPVYQIKQNPHLKNSEQYPLGRIKKTFYYYRFINGQKVKKYPLSSTISFMLALALILNYEEIFLFGIDCKHPNYQFQKDSISYFTGAAAALNKQIIFNSQSEVLKPDFVYQYDEAETIQFSRELFTKHKKTA